METLKYFNQQLPIIGRVKEKNREQRTFTVVTRSGDEFEIHVNATTWFDSVQNLDRLERRRLPVGDNANHSTDPFDTDIVEDDLIGVEGIFHVHDGNQRYDALTIHNLVSNAGYYHFEHTHWWTTQIDCMANKWLDDLFGDKRTYGLDDFAALYRTTLNIQGMPSDDHTQEMATLSRLIYGLSSAYLMSGDERHFLAAKAGVDYQREAFRSISADGRFCLWLHARKRDRNGQYDVLSSIFGDDQGTLPLYEQIYALAGLAQYYRITNDWEVLHDIRRTVATFESMFTDRRDGKHDGFFSHIDPVTFSWNSPELEATDNRAKKNWNSIGDHLPAFLINLLLALDPLPELADNKTAEDHLTELGRFREQCLEILEVTAKLIHDKFPQEGNPYVCERFDRDWNPYYGWGWQQNRAIVGHNLKIAWNLTRVANYWSTKGDEEQANRLFELARRIGLDMGRLGIDQIRSGVFDAVERDPADPNIPVQFAWLNTKDFWQQEQGILAYLIMFGSFRDPDEPDAQDFLSLGRELCAFWNLYFLDHERSGVYFRVSDNGTPVIKSTYGDKGGHSISGYHVFELDYLAHLYHRAYLPRQQRQHTVFCLHFRPSENSLLRSINVLPDFLGPDAVEIEGVVVDGVERPVEDPTNFQVRLQKSDLGHNVIVRFRQTASAHERLRHLAPEDHRLG
jgi:mannose/cellobiose epimerase-like protein (N-acyl-D-glucosamine 2-epimerase family)